MKKILYIENEATARAINFYKAALEASKIMGWEFHLAYNCIDYSEELIKEVENELGHIFHQIDFRRNPVNLNNVRAYKQLCKLVDREEFDLIHCNTPIGGVLGRIVANKKKIQPVIYQAHGFHFYKGAPLKNWLLYYPVEKLLAKKTDAIITINKDDYEFAKINLKSKIYYVPGVGIELGQWSKYRDIREELGLKADDFVVLVVGRLEKNKNCEAVLNAVSKVSNVKLVFCGDGEDRQMLEEKAKELGNRVIFLGNRSDMSNIYHMADCFVLASYREGLSRSIMEAMACGLPCIVTDIRGNRDLIDKGFLFNPNDVDDLADKIRMVSKSQEQRNMMRVRNLKKIREFSFDRVVDELSKIYEEVYDLEMA